MKKILFFLVMIGAMSAGSLVCAAQKEQPSAPAQAQVESIDEEVKEIKSKPQKLGDVSAREQEMARVLSGFSGSAGGAFPGEVARLAAGYDSGALWLDPKAGTRFKMLQHGDGVRSVAISDDDQLVVTGSWDGVVRIWDRQSGKLVHEIHHPNHMLTMVGISQNGRWIVTTSSTTGRIWNGQSGALEGELEDFDEVLAVAISEDGRWVVTGSGDDMARIWDRQSGKVVHELIHPDEVVAVAISKNGRWVVTGSYDKTVRIWNGQSGELVHQLKHANEVLAVAISDDSKWVITGSKDLTARIWDMQSGKLAHELEHAGGVHAVAINGDGEWVVTASNDRTVRIWCSKSWGTVRKLEHPQDVLAVAISRDGRWLVTGSRDGARIWWAEPASGPSVDQQLIDIINRRIDLRGADGLQEMPDDIQRALVLIKKQIALGANPAVMVPVGDGGKRVPLWQMVQEVFGANHEIAKYLKKVSE